ncbi:AAA domain-containing protein [Ilumatobacter sp.]|uniref:AAA domain-containing protein n=1 Tax=Ilumatobacter sp. TaxID=1967498 RepID=UPI003752D721
MAVQWLHGDAVTVVGEASTIRERAKKDGSPFVRASIELADGTQAECVWWDASDAPQAGETVRIEGTVKSYQGVLEIHARQTSRLSAGPTGELALEQRILGYYGDCAEAESQQDLTLAPGHRGHLTLEQGPEPVVTEPAGHVWEMPADARFARWAQDRLMAAGGELVLAGYPTVVGGQFVDGRVRTRHAPLFTVEARVRRQESGNGFELERIEGPIDVNIGALQLLGVDRQERNAIADALDRSETIAIASSTGERFEAMIAVVWELLGLDAAAPEPAGLSPIGNSPGIHNAVVLLAAARQPMTRGLLDDLAALATQPIEHLRSGPLGIFLGAKPLTKSTIVDPLSFPVVVPSCVAQDLALTGCMTEEFTVVTGPPGTGKSQVVVNAVSAAVVAGESVLFASKNNQAIDVVFERLSQTIPISWPLRAGANRYRSDMAATIRNAIERQRQPEGAAADIHRNWQRVEREVAEIHAFIPARRSLAAQAEQMDKDLTQLLQSLPASMQNLEPSNLLAERIGELEQALDAFRCRLGLFRRWRRHNVRLDGARQALKNLAEEVGDIAMAELKLWETISDVEDRPRRSARPSGEARARLVALRSVAEVASVRMERRSVQLRLDAIPQPWELDDRLAALEDERLRAGRALVELSWRSRMKDAKAANLTNASDFANRISPTEGGYGGSAREKVAAMLTAFPAWGVTNLSTGSNFPVVQGLFDLVIIDEASQCDPASVLSLLFRAKRAVIIGDDRQLPHISSLNKGRNITIADKWQLDRSTREEFSYPHRSAFAIGRARVGGQTQFLNLHFRSHPSIIDFSNSEFYDRRLEICTDPSRYIGAPAVMWDDCDGSMIRGSGGRSWRNVAEARRIVVLAAEQARQSVGKGLTVGVVSPFRAQVEQIRRVLSEEAPELVESITVDTAHRYQGGERDIMLMSTVLAGDSDDFTARFAGDAQLVNVGLTRARSRLIVVGSRSACAASGGVLADLAAYVKGLNPDRFDSRVEALLFDALARVGLSCDPGRQVAGYRLDLAIEQGGVKFDVECDGEPFHRDRERDRTRDEALRREGWTVLRYSARTVLRDVDECARQIALQAFEEPIKSG